MHDGLMVQTLFELAIFVIMPTVPNTFMQTSLLQREQAAAQGQSLVCYAPIAMALYTLDEGEKVKLRHKFDIAYFIAREKLSFRKYPQLVKLEAKHGVSIGTNYITETAAMEFTHYIAESVR